MIGHGASTKRWFVGASLAAVAAMTMAACDGDEAANSDSTDTSSTVDITVTPTECGYDQECVAKVNPGPCQRALCVEGACVAEAAPEEWPCELANAGDCEIGRCNASQECRAISAADGTPCRDADWSACTGYSCTAGQCEQTALVTCNDDNECTADTCDDTSGCVFTPTPGPCNDGDACTLEDTCADGVCVSGEPCECTTDADCGALEDGDRCNGTLVCNLTTLKCEVDAATIVTCEGEGEMEEGSCTAIGCNPVNGNCESVAAADYTRCEDGDSCSGCAPGDASCTQFDFCLSGVCKAGLGDPCSCTESSDCAVFDDGDACTGVWTCQDSLCALDETTVVDCSGQEAPACQALACNPTNGACEASPVDDGTACDDGDACTGGDACAAGACEAGAQNLCLCTEDAECASFDDGDLCNGVWTCQEGTCAPAADSAVTCDDPGACNMAACNPATGSCDVTPMDNGTSCDDGDVCTTDDSCTDGVCGGTSGGCDCTEDSECESFDDGDKCNGIWTCQTGTCAYDAATVVDCTGTETATCMVAECTPATGSCDEVPAANGSVCEDDDTCKTGDSCMNGVCMAGAVNAPDDTSCTPAGFDTDCGGCVLGLCTDVVGCLAK